MDSGSRCPIVSHHYQGRMRLMGQRPQRDQWPMIPNRAFESWQAWFRSVRADMSAEKLYSGHRGLILGLGWLIWVLNELISGLRGLILGLIRALSTEKADFLSEKADLRSWRADLRPERADFRPEKANWRFKRAYLRSERADFRLEGGDRTKRRNCPLWNHRSLAAAQKGITAAQKRIPYFLSQSISASEEQQKTSWIPTNDMLQRAFVTSTNFGKGEIHPRNIKE